MVDGGSGGGAGDDGMLPRAQYISASCVVFTNYSGDTSTVVDEHFSRALNFSNKESKGEFLFIFLILTLYCQTDGNYIKTIKYNHRRKKAPPSILKTTI